MSEKDDTASGEQDIKNDTQEASEQDRDTESDAPVEYFDKKSAKDDSEAGQVKATIEKLVDGRLKEDEVPQWLIEKHDVVNKAKSKKELEERVGELDSLKSEVESLKEFKKQLSETEDKKAAMTKLDSFLSRNGWTKSDFDKEYGDKLKTLISDNYDGSYLKAIGAAIGELVVSGEFSPKSKKARNIDGKTFPQDGGAADQKDKGSGFSILRRSSSPKDWYSEN